MDAWFRWCSLEEDYFALLFFPFTSIYFTQSLSLFSLFLLQCFRIGQDTCLIFFSILILFWFFGFFIVTTYFPDISLWWFCRQKREIWFFSFDRAVVEDYIIVNIYNGTPRACIVDVSEVSSLWEHHDAFDWYAWQEMLSPLFSIYADSHT